MTYLNPPKDYQSQGSTFHIIPCPYEGNTSYGDGASDGPQAIMEASHHLPYYDERTETEPYKEGVRTHGAQATHDAIRSKAAELHSKDVLPVYIGGDHSITLPATQPLPDDADVVILDAHADMHYKWNGEKANHACVTRHVSAERNVTVLGVRSMDRAEHEAANDSDAVDLVGPSDVHGYDTKLSRRVHVSIDADAFDPSTISHTGTPEPGGLTYDDITAVLDDIISNHDVVSVDVAEFAPCGEEPATKRSEAYTLAKLIYHVFGLTLRGHGDN